MLIESLLKPGKGLTFRTITLFGTRYEFRPLIPDRYVADVTDDKHVQTFLAVPTAYRQFDPAELPGATLSRGSAATTINAVITGETTKDPLPTPDEADVTDVDDGEDLADGGASDDPGEWPTAVADEAAKLLSDSAKDIGAALGRVTSLEVVKCALALERHKTGGQKPRKGVIELLEQTLKDAAAAGAV